MGLKGGNVAFRLLQGAYLSRYVVPIQALGANMRRREFFGVIGGAAASAWPLETNAQPAGMPVIGYFSSRSSTSEAPLLPAFRLRAPTR
jgi:hypothetical protein